MIFRKDAIENRNQFEAIVKQLIAQYDDRQITRQDLIIILSSVELTMSPEVRQALSDVPDDVRSQCKFFLQFQGDFSHPEVDVVERWNEIQDKLE